MLGFRTVLYFICFLIGCFAFVWGANALFRKNVVSYYKICICAVGSYTLSLLTNFVFNICNSSLNYGINICLLGIFGCLCFMVSANLGGDSINEKKEIRIFLYKKDIIAYIAPILFAIVLIIVFVPIYKTWPLFDALYLTFIFLPVLPVSYLSLLYLIKPADKLQMFRYTKLCNLSMLLFCINSVLFLYLSYAVRFEFAYILVPINTLLSLLLVIGSIRGAKKWKI